MKLKLYALYLWLHFRGRHGWQFCQSTAERRLAWMQSKKDDCADCALGKEGACLPIPKEDDHEHRFGQDDYDDDTIDCCSVCDVVIDLLTNLGFKIPSGDDEENGDTPAKMHHRIIEILQKEVLILRRDATCVPKWAAPACDNAIQQMLKDCHREGCAYCHQIDDQPTYECVYPLTRELAKVNK